MGDYSTVAGVFGEAGEEILNLEARAQEFATKAHGAIGQRRKYTGDPYIVHPGAVVCLVKTIPHTEEMVAAAWLHDVVEDTGVPLARIYEEFGEIVGMLVGMVTDVSRPEDGSRAVRKALDRVHLASASPEAKSIKLADLIDNAGSILQQDRDFAWVYLKEKRLLLHVLAEGDKQLLVTATGIVNEGLFMLENLGRKF